MTHPNFSRFFVLMLAVGVCVFPLGAQDSGRKKNRRAKQTESNASQKNNDQPLRRKKITAQGNVSKRSVVTPEREAAAMTFVQRHHQELAEVLVQLKEKSPRQYGRAIRDLFRTSEKLAQTREKNYQRYELDLSVWKAQSRAQLLAARLKTSRVPSEKAELREKLNAILEVQLDFQQQIVQRNRDALVKRLERLDKQLQRMNDNREKIIKRQMSQLLSGKSKKTVSVKRVDSN